MLLCDFVRVCDSVSACVHAFVRVCVWVCPCVYMRVYLCEWVCMRARVCAILPRVFLPLLTFLPITTLPFSPTVAL